MAETINKNEELAETFNSFSSSMVDNLKIEYDINSQANVSTHQDFVLQAIETFKYHPGILKIKHFMAKVCHSLSTILIKKKPTRHCKTQIRKKHVKKMTSLRKWSNHTRIYFLTLPIITSITHCSFQFFSQNWKRPILHPFIKRRGNLLSTIIVPLVSIPFSLKFMKGVCLIKCS